MVATTVCTLGACAPSTPPALPPAASSAHVAPAPPVRVTPVEPPRDAVTGLIDSAERQFAAGQQALQQGHLTGARAAFDEAVGVLLASPQGARGDERLQVEYDRLLDRISALEATALRQGDGFSESRSEPAAIDELLATATFPRPAPALTTNDKVAADLAVTPHDLPIAVNEKVLSYVELFQGTLRPFVEDGLARGARYLPMIEGVLREKGLPLDLAFVPLIESAFKPTALSRASARGLWQFESATAIEAGLKQNWFLDERADPERATVAAATYLKQLYNMFGHDWYLALAAYNVGLGKVQKAVKQAGTDDFWALSASTTYLPRDTREYVPMILAAIIIARNPAQYDFDISGVEPLAYDRVTVPDALDLRRIAEWTESTLEDIRDLNPELRRMVTPVGAHEVKVPVGKGAALEARLATADPKQFATLDFHVVKKGETLLAIARRFQVTRADLASANNLKTGAKLQAGASLLIPRLPTTLMASRPAASVTKNTAPASTASTVTYKVKPGDTLLAIARQFDTSVAHIKQWNRLKSDAIGVGDKLTIHRQ
jgi:membrane-bound lytic murein transglycosylase D